MFYLFAVNAMVTCVGGRYFVVPLSLGLLLVLRLHGVETIAATNELTSICPIPMELRMSFDPSLCWQRAVSAAF